MSLENELRAEQSYSSAWDKRGYLRQLCTCAECVELRAMARQKTSTKACPKCGDTKLVLLTSQNAKICSACKYEFVWTLDDNQKPVY